MGSTLGCRVIQQEFADLVKHRLEGKEWVSEVTWLQCQLTAVGNVAV